MWRQTLAGLCSQRVVKHGILSFVTPKRQTVTAGGSCYGMEKEGVSEPLTWVQVSAPLIPACALANGLTLDFPSVSHGVIVRIKEIVGHDSAS